MNTNHYLFLTRAAKKYLSQSSPLCLKVDYKEELLYRFKR